MICFVVALKSEAKTLLSKVDNLKETILADKPTYSFTINGINTVLSISGIGKVSAALTTQLLIDKFSPKFIINFGTCGGMNNSVKALNYYLVEKCCQYDFDLSKLDNVPRGYIQEYDTVFFPTYTTNLDFIEKSVLASADKFTSEKEDVDVVNQMGCSLCDMEGSAIAQVCASNNVPFVIIKGITDVHGSNTAQEQFFANLSTVGNGFPSIIFKLVEKLDVK